MAVERRNLSFGKRERKNKQTNKQNGERNID
jgi:hypothetical protein